MQIEYVLWCMLGSLFGTIVGIIPLAGATTGLLLAYNAVDYFLINPYAGVAFLTALVASTGTSDSYASILTGVPGSSTSVASIIDGHQMAINGQAARAIGLSLIDSTVNGLLWGSIAFFLMPFYSKILLIIGIPELTMLMVLSLACIGFITSTSYSLGLLSVALGAFIGLIGQNPGTGAHRFTGGWDYLAAGIQILPLIIGLFVVPELIKSISRQYQILPVFNYWSQIRTGIIDAATFWRDVLRGGAIGFGTGLVPGVGGAVGDLIAYGATVAAHPSEKFGTGNPRGLAGCEGANNAQKPASLIPTILFGIPAAPFAAIMMALLALLGFEMGSPALLADTKFIHVVAFSFLASSAVCFAVCLVSTQAIIRLLQVPNWVYALFIASISVWSAFQYTGTINDLYMLIIAVVFGWAVLFCKLSAPAILISYVLSEKLENYSQQTYHLYSLSELSVRPLFVVLLLTTIVVFLYQMFCLLKRKN